MLIVDICKIAGKAEKRGRGGGASSAPHTKIPKISVCSALGLTVKINFSRNNRETRETTIESFKIKIQDGGEAIQESPK